MLSCVPSTAVSTRQLKRMMVWLEKAVRREGFIRIRVEMVRDGGFFLCEDA